jgi:hypothetical protein
MERTKLSGLIKDKNAELERTALRTAEQIIEAIALEQQRILDSQQNIVELRKDLKSLEVTQLDTTAILGEE